MQPKYVIHYSFRASEGTKMERRRLPKTRVTREKLKSLEMIRPRREKSQPRRRSDKSILINFKLTLNFQAH